MKLTGRAKIASIDSIEVASFTNNSFKNIPQYSRFEVGLKLPPAIQQSVTAFLSGALSGTVNPYDPDQVAVSCTYSALSTGKTYKRNGFYYQDFTVINNVWTEIDSDYTFRLRFAPPDPGRYAAVVKVHTMDSLIGAASFTFDVVASKNPGHLRINNTLVKLEFSSGKPFFGIGENIPWADLEVENPNFPRFQSYWESISTPNSHNIHRAYLDNLADNRGNFVRIRLDAWSVPIESMDKRERPFMPAPHYPEQLTKYVTNYHHNQMFMWEMDRTLEKCEQRNLYILLTIFPDCDFGINDTTQIKGGNTMGGWHKNPYSGLLHDNTINGLHKFFTSEIAKKAAKKRLHYIEARWGYSTSFALWELFNETENLTHDVFGTPPYFLWDDPDSSIRTDFGIWVCEMQDELHSYYPNHIVTNGTTDGRFPGTNANLFKACKLDVECKHDYTYEVDTVKNLYASRDYNRNEFCNSQFMKDQPYLFGEIGLVDNVTSLSIKGDAYYHNTVWASVFSGAISTALNLIDYTSSRGINHRLNFPALNEFVQKIPFNHRLIPYSNFAMYGGYTEYPTSDVLTFWLKKENNQEVWGWTKNNSFNWMSDSYPNLTPSEQENVRERSRWNGEAEFKSFEDDDKKIKVKHLNKRHKYRIQIYGTWDETGILETKYEKTDKNGLLSFGRKMPYYRASPWYPDYAFVLTDVDLEYENKGKDKVYPSPASDFIYVYADEEEWESPHFEVYDEFGRNVSVPQDNTRLNVQALEGFYIVKIVDANHSKCFKVIILK
jgi:hypothetical protein